MLQSFIVTLIGFGLYAGAFNLPVAAFQNSSAAVQSVPASVTGSKPASGKKSTKANPHGAKPAAMPTASQVSPAKSDFLSGEATVTVHGNTNTLIRLGLAQGGVTLVEFPADDPLYAIHPGNQDLVTVDVSSKKASDPLIFRPGSGFIAKDDDSGPATLITVQMASGLVCTFLIYPVRQLAQSAYRIVLSYNRSDVIAARRAAGLSVDLGGGKPIVAETRSSEKQTDALSKTRNPETTSPEKIIPVSVVSMIEDSQPTKSKRQLLFKSDKTKDRSSEITKLAHEQLEGVSKSPKKLSEWSKPLHGLSVATGKAIDIDESRRLVIVAVRNEVKDPIRLLADSPEVLVQTMDDKKKPVQMETLKRTVVETTALDGVVPAGQTVYYALVYESPILGAKQQLQVAVSQRNAADEPAAASLATVPR